MQQNGKALKMSSTPGQAAYFSRFYRALSAVAFFDHPNGVKVVAKAGVRAGIDYQ